VLILAKKEFIGIDDRGLDEIIYSPVCLFCRHFHLKGHGIHECDAFPDRIPDEIWRGDNDHKKPYPGDHGIRFEKVN
jgi:hypothetical protein